MISEQKETLPQVIARKFVEHMEAFLEEAKSIIQSHSQLPPSVKAEIDLPNIDLHELEHDPAWRSWKKDENGQCTFPVEEDQAGWIRIKTAGNTVLTLVKAMKKQGLTKVSLGLFEYKISGEDFLQRRPLRKPEEKDPHTRMERNISNVKEASEKHAGREQVKEEAKAQTNVENVKQQFPEDLAVLLTFQQEGNYIVIKPRQYLGSDNFAKILSIAEDMDGEFISAGKESHFKIPWKTS